MTPYARGLHEVGDGVFAWLLPDGGWGWSNAGLLVGDGTSLLVDTLFDLPLTREMLEAMAAPTAAAPIGTLVNTHANGDHCYGNSLVGGARIVASRATAEEMDEVPPSLMAAMVEAAPGVDPVLGEWMQAAFGPFDFSDHPVPGPTETFDGELALSVGGRLVELHEVGPAHTAGDVIVHLPDDRVVFTGDIVFHRGTPVMWAGPIDGWIAACDRIVDLLPDVVVPGHGAVTDVDGVRAARGYLAFVRDELTPRLEAGMGYLDAVQDLDLGPYAELHAPGRIVVTAHTMARTLQPAAPPADVLTLFTEMARFERDLVDRS
jgi:glyoxylase-like metal-dependent hydrolase (beta-lactamase superfamily II)